MERRTSAYHFRISRGSEGKTGGAPHGRAQPERAPLIEHADSVTPAWNYPTRQWVKAVNEAGLR